MNENGHAHKDTRKLIEEIVKQQGWSDQVLNNQQTFLLLIQDDKFQHKVKLIRKQLHIPLKNGFRAKTKSLKKWAESLDDEEWDEALYSVLTDFPRINENFLQHIGLYIKFNNVYYAPILDHRIGYMQIDGQTRDWVNVTLYNPPNEKEWQRIKHDVEMHYRRHDISRTKPIKHFDSKMRTLEPKGNLDMPLYVIDEYGQKVTDEMLADQFNKSGLPEEQAKAINLVRKYRERIKKDKKRRLG